MSNNFEWHTEGDRDWDKLTEEEPPEQPSNDRRRWLTILVIAAVFIGLGAAFYQMIDRRVEENTGAMRTDVVSSYNLLQLAEEEQDDELFYSLLSGRDNAWTAAQYDLYEAKSLANRAPFGLRALPSDPLPQDDDESYSISFSPDLQTAELSRSRPYEIQIGNGVTETVQLLETGIFRLGRTRWLLSPPDSEFWGAQTSADGTRISLSYPERDSELANRLLVDLDQKVAEICSALAEIDCDSDLQLNITMSTDVAAVVAAAKPQAAQTGTDGLNTTVPTPTLLGLPQDEAGYQALYRGYAGQLVTALVAHQVGYECCEQLPLFQALIDKQLSELGLKPWPVTERDYERILLDQVRLQDLSSLWRSDDPLDLYGPEGWRVYAVVDYLLDVTPGSSALTLQRELVRRGSFLGWLNGLLAEDNERTNTALLSQLTRGLWLRGYSQTLEASAGWGSNPPDQDLYLTCAINDSDAENAQIATLYHFDLQASTWSPVFATPSYLWASPLPGDVSLLQQEFSNDDRGWSARLREHEVTTPLLPGSSNYIISFAQTDPQVTGLAAFVFAPSNDDAVISWFDLRECAGTEGCANRELPGLPIWSPDGRRALFTQGPDTQIDLLRLELRILLFDAAANFDVAPFYLAERSAFLEGEPITRADELDFVARGHAPFWLDNETIGYISDGGDTPAAQNTRLMVTDTDGTAPQELLNLGDLLEAMEEPQNGVERLYWIQYVMVHPEQPNELYVVLLTALSQRAHVLSFNRETREVQHLMTAGYLANHSFSLSPDGRYLILTGTDDNDPNAGDESALLQIYDLQERDVIPFLSLTASFPPFSTYDWSLEGDWLAFLPDDNTVGFLSPDDDLLHLVDAPTGQCGSPAWINRQT